MAFRTQRTSSVCIVMALVVTMMLTPGVLYAAQAQEPAVKSTYTPSLKVQPGEFTGTILALDGRTPITKLAVKLVRADDGKLLTETKTDEKGQFTLKDLQPGRYVLTIGAGLRGSIEVSDEAIYRNMQLKVDKASVDSPRLSYLTFVNTAEAVRGAGNQMDPVALRQALLWTLLAVGVAAAIAIPLAVSGGGGGGHHKAVSP